jgi:hypothetical protein
MNYIRHLFEVHHNEHFRIDDYESYYYHLVYVTYREKVHAYMHEVLAVSKSKLVLDTDSQDNLLLLYREEDKLFYAFKDFAFKTEIELHPNGFSKKTVYEIHKDSLNEQIY